MSMSSQDPSTSKAMWWTGMVLSVLPSLMLLLGPVFLLIDPEKAQQGLTEHGYPAGVAVPLTAVAFICTVLYLIPQTAVLGAILLTGYLGGAVATHVIKSEWSQAPIAVIFGVVLWLGLYFRDARIRAIVPLRS